MLAEEVGGGEGGKGGRTMPGLGRRDSSGLSHFWQVALDELVKAVNPQLASVSTRAKLGPEKLPGADEQHVSAMTLRALVH